MELFGWHDHADRRRTRDRGRHPQFCYEAAGHALGRGCPRHVVRFGNLEIGSIDGGIGRAMSFTNGILNLTNWAGNVILPTLAALFLAIAVLRFARSESYAAAMYGAFLCLMASGLLRAMETFASQRAWNDPDVYWMSLVSLVDWICNVLMQVLRGASGCRWRSAHGNRHAGPSHRRMVEAFRGSGTLFAFVGPWCGSRSSSSRMERQESNRRTRNGP